MILEKTDRLRLMAEEGLDFSSGPEFLITNNAETPENAAMLETALEAVRNSSKGPASLWDKFTANAGYSEALSTQTKDNLTKNYANRRINSFGAVAEPEFLPKGFKALAILPQVERTTYSDTKALRQTVVWAGVLDNGTLLHGQYVPTKPVMPIQEAFAEIGEGLFSGNGTVYNTNMAGFSLDGYGNGKNWKATSAGRTENALHMAALAEIPMELAQTGKDRLPKVGPRQQAMSEEQLFEDVPFDRNTKAGPESPERTAGMNRKEFREQYTGHLWRVARVTANNLKGKEVGTMWKCMRALEGALNQDALRATRIGHKPTSTTYNWLNGANRQHVTLRVSLFPENRFAKDNYPRPDVEGITQTDPEMAKRRQQAVGLFPILARDWLAQLEANRENKNLFRVINEGEELVPFLAQDYNVTQRHIKSIRGLTWQMTGNQDCRRDANAFLRVLPLDRMPTNRKDWANYRKTLAFTKDLTNLPHSMSGDARHESDGVYVIGYDALDKSRPWGHYKNGHPNTNNTPAVAWGADTHEATRGLTPKNPPTPQPGTSLWEDVASRYGAVSKSLGDYTPGGVRDMLEYVGKHLIEPIQKAHAYNELMSTGEHTPQKAIAGSERKYRNYWGGVPEKTVDALVRLAHHWSLRDIAEAQNRWHRNITALNDQVQDPALPSSHEEWKGVLGTVDLGNGLVARELTSAAALRKQGMSEDHCVGGYTPQILNNRKDTKNTLIFSIEKIDEHGNRKVLSTLDLKVEHTEKGPKTTVQQNYARKNTPPGPIAIAAGHKVASVVRRTKLDKFEEHYHSIALVPTKQKTIAMGPNPQDTIPQSWVKGGYDPRNEERMQIAFDAFKPLLPKSIKSLDQLKTMVLAGEDHAPQRPKQPRTASGLFGRDVERW